MTSADKTRRFSPTEHLASEAVAAYVDGELRMNAYLRASHHLSMCPSCAAEVDTQMQARAALRTASEVTMPHTLAGLLSQIPHCTPPIGPPAPGTRGPLARAQSISELGSAVTSRFRRR